MPKTLHPGKTWRSSEIINEKDFKITLLMIEDEVHHIFVSGLNIPRTNGQFLTSAFLPLSRDALLQSIGEPSEGFDTNEFEIPTQQFNSSRPDDKSFFTISVGVILKNL